MGFYIFDQGVRISTPVESLFRTTDVQKVSATRRLDRIGEEQKVPPTAAEDYYPDNQGQQSTGSGKTFSKAFFAADIMTAPVQLIEADKTIDEAWSVFSRAGFHHLPVVNAQQALCGILSDRDLLKSAASNQHVGQLSVAQAMTTRVITADFDTEIRVIADVMCQQRIGALPVIEQVVEHNQTYSAVRGIVTRSDILRALVNHAPLELWV